MNIQHATARKMNYFLPVFHEWGGEVATFCGTNDRINLSEVHMYVRLVIVVFTSCFAANMLRLM